MGFLKIALNGIAHMHGIICNGCFFGKENMKISVSEAIAKFIAAQNTQAVFQLSGGMTVFMVDAINELGVTRVINNKHEQASGFGAEGSAKSNGFPSFAFATSGPGATNLVTPIASCYFDSAPVIFITGQVNQNDLRKSLEQRQNGFQELDICSLVQDITKKTYKVVCAENILEILEDAWLTTMNDRKGPVLIDIPINIQQVLIEEPKFQNMKIPKDNLSQIDFKDFETLFEQSRFPLIIAGGGIIQSNTQTAMIDFANKFGIPIVTSLMGLGSIPTSAHNNLGFIGTYGNRWANYAVEESDLLLVFGSRLDGRQTGSNIPNFTKNKKIIRVDIDPHELVGRVKADLNYCCSLPTFFENFDSHMIPKDPSKFLDHIAHFKNNFPQENEQKKAVGLNPNNVMAWISQIFHDAHGYVVDVGQHQMWAAQSIDFKEGQLFLTSGGLGAMGFALPAAIGASVNQEGKWVVIVGDGCLQLSSNEILTVVQYDLPIAICLFNNMQHGMVAQFQEEYLDSRFTGTKNDYSVPDFGGLARVYGIKQTYQVCNQNELLNLSEKLTNWVSGPIFIEIIIDFQAKALPKRK